MQKIKACEIPSSPVGLSVQEAFLAENSLSCDLNRLETGNNITAPAAGDILGYE